MGTIAADAVLEKASILLEDRASRHWTLEELLGWANDGQLAVVQLRPDAYTRDRTVQLVEGTRQSVPVNDLRLIDVPRNMGTDGATPGRACEYIDRKQIDLSDPNWHTATPAAEIIHWTYSQMVPKTWWCYPPQPAANQGYAEMDVSAVPPNMTIQGIGGQGTTNTLQLDDIWLNPVLQFCVYRAFSKDSEYTVAGGKSDLAWREFLQVMGLKTETAKRFDPSKDTPPRVDGRPKTDTQGAFGTP